MEEAIYKPTVWSRQGDEDSAMRSGALAEALKEAVNTKVDRRGSVKGLNTPSDSAASEDESVDPRHRPQVPVMLRRRVRQQDSYDSSVIDTPEIVALEDAGTGGAASAARLIEGDSSSDDRTSWKKTYVVASDDMELRDILRRGLERVCTAPTTYLKSRLLACLPLRHLPWLSALRYGIN